MFLLIITEISQYIYMVGDEVILQCQRNIEFSTAHQVLAFLSTPSFIRVSVRAL